ncbi:MAG: hypothetical protein ACI4K7_02820 [Oscillospiraceae bacterium]
MNNRFKKTAGAIVAVVAIAAMSVSVYAADYGNNPSYSDSSSTQPSAPAGEVNNAIDNAVEEASVSDKVEDALNDVDLGESDSSSESTSGEAGEAKAPVATVEVKNTNKLVLNASTVKKLAKTENGVLEIVAPKATISIDATSIDKVKKIDLSMSVKSASNSTRIVMKSDAQFGCEVKITVTNCKMKPATLKKAHVYVTKVDPETGKKVEEDLGLVELDENGKPVITVTQGAEYTIRLPKAKK